MFFTRIGKIIAHLMFWSAAFQLAVSCHFAFTTPDMESNRAVARRYLSAESTGEAISDGMRYILLALALGVLCEVSSRRNKPSGPA